jgi:hypothetical protein
MDGSHGGSSNESAWPIHDRILGVQSAALTQLMNPTTLRRVYDNELRLPEDVEALTLPELLDRIGNAAWDELDKDCPEGRNDRKPMISSFRRNLQREHLQRLIDLILEPSESTAAYKPISTLARQQLKSLAGRIEKSVNRCADKMDAYTSAHLAESKERIERALAAGYTYNGGGQQIPIIMLGVGQEEESP